VARALVEVYEELVPDLRRPAPPAVSVNCALVI